MNRRKFFADLGKAGLLAGLSTSGAAVGLSGCESNSSDARSPISETNEGLPFQNLDPDSQEFWKAVQSQFPVSTGERTYLNTATFGPSSFATIERLKHEMDRVEARGTYTDNSTYKQSLGRVIGASEDSLVATSNTTHGVNIIAHGVQLEADSEIIMTTHEHAGGALPWLLRAKRDGIRLRAFEPALTASGNLSRIEALRTTNTKVLAIPHISTTTGTVFPIEELAHWCRQHDILCCIDGAHGPGSTPLELDKWAPHSYASSMHKWMCGPSEVGFLYIHPDLQDQLTAVNVGAGSAVFWEIRPEDSELQMNESIQRFEWGTRNAYLRHGAAAAAELIFELGSGRIAERIRSLQTMLRQELATVPSIELLSPVEEESMGPMTTFRIPGYESTALRGQMGEAQFRVRHILEANLDAFRISTHIFNDEDELKRFGEFLRTLPL